MKHGQTFSAPEGRVLKASIKYSQAFAVSEGWEECRWRIVKNRKFNGELKIKINKGNKIFEMISNISNL